MKPTIKWDIHWQVAAKHIMIQCQVVFYLEFALLINFSGLAESKVNKVSLIKGMRLLGYNNI